jgi:hypothetical protein
VEDAVFETSKGLAKGHVADDVEGSEVCETLKSSSRRVRMVGGLDFNLLNQSHMFAGWAVAAKGLSFSTKRST